MGRLNDEDRRREDFIQDRKDDEAQTIRKLEIERGWLELGVTGYEHQSHSGYPKKASVWILESVSLGFSTDDIRPSKYRTWFPKSQANSLRLRLTLRVSDRYFDEYTYAIMVRIYRPDGTVIEEAKDDLRVKEEKNWFHRVGERHVGKWRSGVYGVEAFVEDTLVCQNWFLLTEDEDSNESAVIRLYPLPETVHRGESSIREPLPRNLWFKRLEFYEHGEGETTLEVSREFNTSFARSTTRYIGFWMEVKNRHFGSVVNWLSRPLVYRVKITIYYPDGSLMGEPTSQLTVYPNDRDLNWHHGWGWEEAGNWRPGVYGVQVSMDNVLMIRGWFKIEDDTPNRSTSNSPIEEANELIKRLFR